MDFLELVKERYSVRGYSDKPVEKEKMDYILESARLAPSATNAQPWKLYVATDQKVKEGIYNSYPRNWLLQAPILIVVCVDKKTGWVRKMDEKNHSEIDGAIITEHICLAAASCGLGTCWVCNFNPDLCSKVLDLPKELSPIAIIPLGYPATESIPEKKRKPIEEIVKYI